ncbi:MAG: tRNA (N6-isopentenyl adenosine(37)-C2)-methylthiotransferase MiaB [Nitrospirae bacterium]|nr:tRNA (N6-isopentenyl adenosine(37)-C2)-methylthiotransferase MiaB [Nitrospirota bacterium]
MAKQLFIKTFGCQMNEHDTEKIAGVLSNLGYSLTDSPDGADMIILNTCSVREKAEYKCYSDLGRLLELKKKNPDLVIGVGGCVAQQEGERIVQKAPYVDMVFGTDNISEIPKLLEKKKGQRKGAVSTERRKKGLVPQGGTDFISVPFPSMVRNHPVKAYVNIVDGCDKFCTYCVVPHTRGRERSRQPEDICHEIQGLASAGYKEVTLLGQNVDSYGKDTGGHTDLADLLHRINDIPGIMSIRFVTSHPADFGDRLINAMKRLPKVCEHLHLPLQSGSDTILERMKRNYTYPEYRDKIRRLREAIPDVAVTTDIITGFPGESAEDFDKTLEAIEEIQYDGIFAFKYSRRPYTSARLYGGQVPREVSEERLSQVLEIQDCITQEKNQACIGREFDILIEGESKKDKRNLTGRTRGNKIVHIPMEEGISIGAILRVRITSATLASLKGEVVRQGRGL